MTRATARRLHALAVASFCVSHFACAHRDARAPVPEEQIVHAPATPDAKSAPRIIVQPDPPLFVGYWAVPMPVAERANDGLRIFLVTQDPDLASQLPDYYGQFLGVHSNGRDVVHLNFFCPEEFRRIEPYAKMYKGDAPSLDWTRTVFVEKNRYLDHGRKHCFFSVDFDPISNRYVDFLVSD